MYNYSDISLGKLEEDLKNTIEECKDLVSNIKSSENIDLSNFNELESAIYDLSGRIAFMGDVHPDEKIRDFGNEADSKIQNLALEIFKDQDLYEKFKEIETKKGTVLIKPEVAELYLKSRDRLPDKIKKNMDRMAERSPDGLFTVLQAALNDLQTGMIENLTKLTTKKVNPLDGRTKAFKEKLKKLSYAKSQPGLGERLVQYNKYRNSRKWNHLKNILYQNKVSMK